MNQFNGHHRIPAISPIEFRAEGMSIGEACVFSFRKDGEEDVDVVAGCFIVHMGVFIQNNQVLTKGGVGIAAFQITDKMCEEQKTTYIKYRTREGNKDLKIEWKLNELANFGSYCVKFSMMNPPDVTPAIQILSP